jgi:hypothetical protein
MVKQGASLSAAKCFTVANMLRPSAVSTQFGLIIAVKMHTGDCETAVKILRERVKSEKGDVQVLM